MSPRSLLLCRAAVIGLLLTGYGLLSDPGVYRRSLDININLWWGLVLLAAGAVLVILARRASRSSS